MKYPEYIMQYVRLNLGLKGNDTSKDELINNMTKKEVLDRVCNWNGLIDYGGQVKGWIEDIYDVELE